MCTMHDFLHLPCVETVVRFVGSPATTTLPTTLCPKRDALYSQSGCCQTELSRALVAVVDAMPAWQFEDAEACSLLVERLCDPSGEGRA